MLKQFFAILWRFLFLFLCSSFLIVFNWGVLFSFLLRKKVRVSLGYLFCIWSMSGACACFSALSCIYIFLSCIIFHYIFYFRTVLLCIFWKIFFRMLSGFCCFCFMLLYKVRKTFGYVFLGYCCRFPRTLLSFFSASAVFVLCFCTKTFRNLYKTEYFLYKKRREFQHVFSVFSGYILSGPRTFLLFPLSIANRKSCFWRSDCPQMAGFILVRPYVLHAFWG